MPLELVLSSLILKALSKARFYFPAEYNEAVDWDTVDKLSETNPEFNKFIKSAVSDIAGKKVHLEEYDKILTDNDMLEYIQKHNI